MKTPKTRAQRDSIYTISYTNQNEDKEEYLT